MQIQTPKSVCLFFLKRRSARIILGHVCVVLMLVVLFFGTGLGSGITGAFAQTHVATQQAVKGQSNPFPYGSCTWWAAQRYHQLTGIYVPWTTQSDAWQWTARARQFHWVVSNKPSPGAIIDLQPWVQWAYGKGHVAVVEKVLSNGHVVTSNMSWGAHPTQVTNVQFTPGPGVTFITF